MRGDEYGPWIARPDLSLFFLTYYFTTLIMTAVLADCVGQSHLPTIAALYKIARF
jgi:hypothetical protein